MFYDDIEARFELPGNPDLEAEFQRRGYSQLSSPTAPVSSSTQFGNTAVLLGSQGGKQILRLLDLNLDLLDSKESWHSGAWVLSLQASNTVSAANSGGGKVPAGAQVPLPVIAIITIGSGAAAIQFQVSVLQGTTLQLPAGAVSVDVQIATAGTSPTNDMRVSAIIQRGESSSNATFIQQIATGSATPPASVTNNVPNMANGLRILDVDSSLFYLNETVYSFENGYDLTGREMFEMSKNGMWLPISQVKQYSITFPAAGLLLGSFVAAASAQFSWRIGL